MLYCLCSSDMPECESASYKQIMPVPSEQETVILAVASQSLEKPPILVFHEQVKAIGGYRVIDEQRQALIEAYFTTEHSFATLARQFGIARTTAQYFVSSGLQTIFAHLPPEMQREYRSSKDVIKLKPHTWKHNQEALQNVRTAQQKRWNRYRQEKQSISRNDDTKRRRTHQRM